MKKLSIILASAMLACLLSACGDAELPDEIVETSQTEQPFNVTKESTQTDVLYAYFGPEKISEYPIEYTGAKKNAEELANELSELTGLDFNITASETDDGLTVDWAADSTLIAGLDDRVQKDDFFFYDNDSLSWFIMDSLWCTLAENLGAENIYYTMDGGKELVLEKMSTVQEFFSDAPYRGSTFYGFYSDVQDDEENYSAAYYRTKGLWRLDGETDTASIEMDGNTGFTMYYADGSVEVSGYLDIVDEYEDGNYRYDCYNEENDEVIASFYFDSDNQIHFGNDDALIYILDVDDRLEREYKGVWMYPDDVTLLEINGTEWKLYTTDDNTPTSWGTVEYDEDAAYLMNEDGSDRGKLYFDEYNQLVESDNTLSYYCSVGSLGTSIDMSYNTFFQGFWKYPDGTIIEINGESWNLYNPDEMTPFAGGTVEYSGEEAYLMNADGSSSGGKLFFNDEGWLTDGEDNLPYLGETFEDFMTE